MKYYSVLFSPYLGTKTYTYKTNLTVQPGDFAVVCTPGNLYQVVKLVEEVKKPSFDCKHLVQVVDFTHYNEAAAGVDTTNKVARL